MAKFMLLQTFYCITGVCFFVRDLYAHVPMGMAMIRAFLWPYAQWLVIKAEAIHASAPVMQFIHQWTS